MAVSPGLEHLSGTRRGRWSRRVVPCGKRWYVPLFAVVCLLFSAWSILGCAGRGVAEEAPSAASTPSSSDVQIARREGSIALYPCNSCHDKIEPTDRPLPLAGKHHTMVFAHFEGVTQCYLCHDRGDMNRLRLLTEDGLSFDASHRLCGQCHGEKMRDFDLGAHGKVVGGWRGSRYRYTCVDCHNPHHPQREQVLALPAPPFPASGIRKGEHR